MGYSLPALARRMTRKKGAPARAVMIPTGISEGARAIRATASAATRKPAPVRMDAGSKTR